MTAIVKPNSLTFPDILNDIKIELAKGDLDLTDFFEASAGDVIARVGAALYEQLNTKLDIYRSESFLNSALRDRSIEYLAISQNNYNPFRNIAPQHAKEDAFIEWTSPNTVIFGPISQIATVVVEGTEYVLSVLSDLIITSSTTTQTSYKARAAIGEWKTTTIELNPADGDYNRFKNFLVSEERNVIDDSDTVQVIVEDQGGEFHTMDPIRDLISIAFLSKVQNADAVLVKTNPFGGIDLNFGDGVTFGAGSAFLSEGEQLGDADDTRGNILERSSAVRIFVTYLVTPGNIANLTFDDVQTNNLVITSIDSLDTLENGSNEETSDSIKTLAPPHSVTLNKIINDSDLKIVFDRLPGVISSFSIQEPRKEVSFPSAWIPTREYFLGDSVVHNNIIWTSIIKDRNIDIEPSEDNQVATQSWALVSDFEDRLNNATLILFALVEDSTIPNTVVEMDEAIFFDRYFRKFNFDARLGFLRVKVQDPLEVPTRFDMTIVLKKVNNPEDLSTTEIRNSIVDIIDLRLNVLGIFLSIGDIVNDITEVNAIEIVYMALPSANRQLLPEEYFTIDDKGADLITTFTFNDSPDFAFGNQT